ncbi:MAG TPA: hypothetical protein VF794_14745, partial [Archangium sp.]|uniref:hypothetical protein n=1 Tax=Archangium sp. TaxID=1872627 RepID=UPI002EDA7CF2
MLIVPLLVYRPCLTLLDVQAAFEAGLIGFSGVTSLTWVLFEGMAWTLPSCCHQSIPFLYGIGQNMTKRLSAPTWMVWLVV